MDDRSRQDSGVLWGAVLAAVLLALLGGAYFMRARSAAAARDVAMQAMAEAEAARLRAESDREEIAELKRQLAEARAPRLTTAASENPRQAVADAAPADAPVAVDLSWLRAAHPERFRDLAPAALAALNELDLRGSTIDDDDLAGLAALPYLTSLSLRGLPITDAGARHLASLRLQTLSLRGTQVTAASLPYVPITVRHLELTESGIGEEGCRFLPPLPALRKLDLNGLPLTDLSLESMPALPKLEHLELDRTKVTVQGVRGLLERFPGLRRIELRDTAVSANTVAELRRRFPAVELVTDSGHPFAGR